MKKNKTRLSITKSKLTELLGYEPFGIEADKSYPVSTILGLLGFAPKRDKRFFLNRRGHRARIIMTIYSLPGWTFYWCQDVNRHGKLVGIGFFLPTKHKK